MKKVLFLMGLAFTLVHCNTPQPATSPETRDTVTTTDIGRDTTARDTTSRDTMRLQLLF